MNKGGSPLLAVPRRSRGFEKSKHREQPTQNEEGHDRFELADCKSARAEGDHLFRIQGKGGNASETAEIPCC